MQSFKTAPILRVLRVLCGKIILTRALCGYPHTKPRDYIRLTPKSCGNPCNLVVPTTSYPSMYVKFWMQSAPILNGVLRNQLVIIIEPVCGRIALEDPKTPDLLRIRRLVMPEKDVFFCHSRDLDLSGRMRHDQSGTLGKTGTVLERSLKDLVRLLNRNGKCSVA